jgi:putative phosphoribosyl transferase
MVVTREMSSSNRFRDRSDAGRQLGGYIKQLRIEQPIVLGLARGGVPVAFEVAQMLASPFDVLVVRKLGVPNHDELAFGAIGEDETRVLNIEMIQRLGLSRKRVARVIERERAELTRRVVRYRGGRSPLGLDGRTVLVVDDGLATGATARVAVELARERAASRVIVAVPVSPRETIAELSGLAIEVHSLRVPPDFRSVGEWYDDFAQTSDDEVASLLQQSSNPGTGTDRA